MLAEDLQNKILYLMTATIIFFELFILAKNNVKLHYDTIIIFLCIFAQIILIIGIEIENEELISFSHFAFGTSLIAIPLLSYNLWLLSIVFIIIIITIIFRHKNKGCPITTFDKNVVDYSFGGRINWDYMYAFFGVIALSKLLYVNSTISK